jgi:hypothetical protein
MAAGSTIIYALTCLQLIFVSPRCGKLNVYAVFGLYLEQCAVVGKESRARCAHGSVGCESNPVMLSV